MAFLRTFLKQDVLSRNLSGIIIERNNLFFMIHLSRISVCDVGRILFKFLSRNLLGFTYSFNKIFALKKYQNAPKTFDKIFTLTLFAFTLESAHPVCFFINILFQHFSSGTKNYPKVKKYPAKFWGSSAIYAFISFTLCEKSGETINSW